MVGVLMHAVSGGHSNVVDLYNSATGSWTTAQLSVARDHLEATSVCNVAFFAGGYSGSASLLRNETLAGVTCDCVVCVRLSCKAVFSFIFMLQVVILMQWIYMRTALSQYL
jgi:hypothetical protein